MSVVDSPPLCLHVGGWSCQLCKGSWSRSCWCWRSAAPFELAIPKWLQAMVFVCCSVLPDGPLFRQPTSSNFLCCYSSRNHTNLMMDYFLISWSLPLLSYTFSLGWWQCGRKLALWLKWNRYNCTLHVEQGNRALILRGDSSSYYLKRRGDKVRDLGYWYWLWYTCMQGQCRVCFWVVEMK